MLERRPAAKDTPDPEFAARALALREALGLRAFDFVMVMEEHGYRLSQSELSRIEHAQRGVTRAIIDAYARIDPARRGRLWWGWGLDADDANVVEVYVGYLRRKIDVPFGRQSLVTVRGVGYRMVTDAT